MRGESRIDHLSADRFRRCQGAHLVGSHQARVTGDIGRKDGSKPTFDPSFGHVVRSSIIVIGKSMVQRRRVSTRFAMTAWGQKAGGAMPSPASALRPEAGVINANGGVLRPWHSAVDWPLISFSSN